MARILLGVTGGIAAYKACTLVRLLVRAGHDVQPVLTSGAERFVAAETFLALARKERSSTIRTRTWRRGDVLVVAPLTANTLARLAHGLADDVLTEAALAHSGPVLVAPAMNRGCGRTRRRGTTSSSARAWRRARRSRRGRARRGRGGPRPDGRAGGDLRADRRAAARWERARGKAGADLGRRHPRAARCGALRRQPLVRPHGRGARGGGEPAGSRRDAARGQSGRSAPSGVAVVETPTAADLEREALARADADVIVMAAAVADYTPAAPSAGKRPKDDEPWTVELEPTTDVLATLGAGRTNGQVLVGFAADGGEPGLERARAKRRAKNTDLVVFNDVVARTSASMRPTTRSCCSSRKASGRSRRRRKEVVAAAVLDEVERLLSER